MARCQFNSTVFYLVHVESGMLRIDNLQLDGGTMYRAVVPVPVQLYSEVELRAPSGAERILALVPVAIS